MTRLVLAAVLGCALAGAPALAADEGNADSADGSVTKGPCRVTPNNGDPLVKDGAADQATLTDKLDRCDSVLAPPKTGDAEIAEPAPNVGETPVIPPSQVPRQAPEE